jgi:3-isopropylmalate/(R)-2-methylmalate dehydratase small subunit
VDLVNSTLTLPSGELVSFPVPPFSKYCVLKGIDEMGFLLGTSEDAARYEAAHPSSFSTLAAGAA